MQEDNGTWNIGELNELTSQIKAQTNITTISPFNLSTPQKETNVTPKTNETFNTTNNRVNSTGIFQ